MDRGGGIQLERLPRVVPHVETPPEAPSFPNPGIHESTPESLLTEPSVTWKSEPSQQHSAQQTSPPAFQPSPPPETAWAPAPEAAPPASTWEQAPAPPAGWGEPQASPAPPNAWGQPPASEPAPGNQWQQTQVPTWNPPPQPSTPPPQEPDPASVASTPFPQPTFGAPAPASPQPTGGGPGFSFGAAAPAVSPEPSPGQAAITQPTFGAPAPAAEPAASAPAVRDTRPDDSFGAAASSPDPSASADFGNFFQSPAPAGGNLAGIEDSPGFAALFGAAPKDENDDDGGPGLFGAGPSTSAEKSSPQTASPAEDELPSMTEGFSSLFANSGKSKDSAAGEALPWEKPRQAGASPFGASSGEKPVNSPASGTFGMPGSGAPEENSDDEEPFGFASESAARPAEPAKFPAPTPKSTMRKRPKKARVFSPLVIFVILLGALFLGVVYLLKAYGGVEGVKSRVMHRVRDLVSDVGASTAAAIETESPPTAPTPAPTTPPTSQASPPPPTPVPDASAPQAPADEAPSTAPSPKPASATEPDPLAPALAEAPVDQPPVTPAPVTVPDATPEPAPPSPTAEVIEPALIEPVPAAMTPPPAAPSTTVAESPAPADTALPNASTVPPATDSAQAAAPSAPEDPGQRMAAILEPVGTEVLESYYASDAIDARAAFVIDSIENQPKMEAYYRRYQTLPTVRDIAFRGPMRDAASGRWFGVFDVRENENEEVHRWCVVQVRPGEMKLDWVIYQQLIDESLDRFLADPASPAKDFRLVIRRGEQAPSDENPWPGTTWELHLQPPLDMKPGRVVLIKESDFQQLGLDTALIGGNARIGRVELGWVASDLEPLTRVPTVTKVLGWGAW